MQFVGRNTCHVFQDFQILSFNDVMKHQCHNIPSDYFLHEVTSNRNKHVFSSPPPPQQQHMSTEQNSYRLQSHNHDGNGHIQTHIPACPHLQLLWIV